MLFATFQPIDVSVKLNEKGVYIQEKYRPFANCCGVGNENIEDELNYKPIFVVPLISKRDFMTRMLLEYPSYPQEMIIFKTNRYDTLSYVKWAQLSEFRNQILRGSADAEDRLIDFDDLHFNDKSKFSEYIVPEIRLEDVKLIHRITDSEVTVGFVGNQKTCSDYLLDFLYSPKMMKILSKIFPKENCKIIDIGSANQNDSARLLSYLELIKRSPDSLTDEFMFEIYNFISTRFIK